MFTETEIATIRNRGKEIEKRGTLPPDILKLIYEKKLFKLFVPNELGGLQLELPEALRTFQDASAMDGNFGWAVTIGSGGNMFLPLMDASVGEKLYGPNESVDAGSGYPTGKAVKTDGGYMVNGEWKYCSGADYASFFTANCYIEENGMLTDTIVSCIFLPEQVQVLYDWGAYGLKGTGSHTIKVENAFIPANYTFYSGKLRNHYGGPVETFPFSAFSEASFTAVCLGIGEDFFRAGRESIERKKNDWSAQIGNRYELVSNKIEDQYTGFKNIEQLFYGCVLEAWKKHKNGETLTEGELQQFTTVCKKCTASVIDSANALIRYFGMEAVMESSPLNRIWRNLYTAGQHIILSPV